MLMNLSWYFSLLGKNRPINCIANRGQQTQVSLAPLLFWACSHTHTLYQSGGVVAWNNWCHACWVELDCYHTGTWNHSNKSGDMNASQKNEQSRRGVWVVSRMLLIMERVSGGCICMALCRGKLYKLMMCGTAKEKAIITRNSWNKQKLSEREQI